MFKHISVSYFASRTLDHELEKNTKTVVPYFSSTFLLMGLFRYVFSIFKTNICDILNVFLDLL